MSGFSEMLIWLAKTCLFKYSDRKLFFLYILFPLIADKNDENNNNAEDNELSEKEKRLAKDYQLQRALDLLKGLSIFEESFEE